MIKSRELIIDPVIEFSSILGAGVNPEEIAYDDAGDVFVLGRAAPGALPATNPLGSSPSYLAKLDPTGSDVIFSTFFDATIALAALAVTPDGSPIVAGAVRSGEAFVAKLSRDGSEMEFTKSLDSVAITAIEVDDVGDIYVAGYTPSSAGIAATSRFIEKRYVDLRGAILVESNDRGATWRRADNGLAAAGVGYIAADPNIPGLLYVAGRRGLFCSYNGGADWTLCLTSRVGVPDVDNVWVAPLEPGTAYALKRVSLFKTTDGGRTWLELPPQQWLPSVAAPDPTTPGKVFAGSRDGVYRSLDGGQSWAPTGLAPSRMDGIVNVDRLLIDPADARILYASSRESKSLWKSSDGGDTWTPIGEGAVTPVQALCLDPSSPDVLLAGTSGHDAVLQRSDDGGLTWQGSDAGMSAESGVYSCAVSPHDPDLVFAHPSRTIYKSEDGGRSWRPASPQLRALALGEVAFDPFEPNRVWAGVSSVNDDSNDDDGFAAKISADGSLVLYSVVFGGSNDDVPLDLAVRSDHQLVVAGRTSSADFPVVEPLQPGFGGAGADSDAFILQLDAAGESIVRSTYWGGTLDEFARGVAVDSQNRVYLSGWTSSTDFPVTNPIQDKLQGAAGGDDGFVARFDFDVGRVEYSTFIGGSGYEQIQGVAADDLGRAYIAGWTSSSDFPVTDRPLIPCVSDPAGSQYNAFVARLSSSGDQVERSIVFGGEKDDDVAAMALRPPSTLVVTGRTESVDFVTGPRGYLGERSGRDLFVTAIDLDSSSATPSIELDCVANGASFRTTPVSPAEIVSLFGDGLGPAEPAVFELDEQGRVPRSLAGTRVLFDGVEAPLLFVSKNQINAIVPQTVAGEDSVSIVVVRSGERTAETRRGATSASPAIFVDPQSGLAAAINEDGGLHGDQRPADAGSVIALFATGLGLPPASLADGAVNTLEPEPTGGAVAATINGLPAEVLYAGPAPGLVQGVWQVNVRIPAEIAGEYRAFVQLLVGDAPSPETPIALRYRRP